MLMTISSNIVTSNLLTVEQTANVFMLFYDLDFTLLYNMCRIVA